MLRFFQNFGVFALCFTLVCFTSSCDNRCATAGCKNGAECYKGQCFCPNGYEDGLCETEWGKKFLGNFTVVNAADCSRVFSSDIVKIDLLKLGIRNLGGFIGVQGCMDYTVTATLKSSTSFVIDETFCNNFRITAQGNFDTNTKKLTVRYNCIRDTDTYNCTAVYQY